MDIISKKRITSRNTVSRLFRACVHPRYKELYESFDRYRPDDDDNENANDDVNERRRDFQVIQQIDWLAMNAESNG